MQYINCALVLTLMGAAMFVVIDPLKRSKHEVSVLKVDVHVLSKFHSYSRDFKKNYTNENYWERLRNFQESLQEISTLNALHGGKKVFGLTKFSDMSASEFRGKMLMSEPHLGEACTPKARDSCPPKRGRNITGLKRAHRLHRKKTVHVDYEKFLEIPDSVDWRKKGVVYPVLNQGMVCRGCWAFSIIGVMESIAAIYGAGKTRLSIQELIDCSTYNQGCEGGNVGSALDFLCLYDYPIVTDAQYPLTLKTEACKMPQTHKPWGRKIKSYKSICNMKEKEILKQLAKRGPLVAVVNAAPWRNYLGGVIQAACEGVWHYMNHVVQIEGYNLTDDVPYYIVRNSWGQDFGDDGYVKLAFGSNVCGVANNVAELTVD